MRCKPKTSELQPSWSAIRSFLNASSPGTRLQRKWDRPPSQLSVVLNAKILSLGFPLSLHVLPAVTVQSVNDSKTRNNKMAVNQRPFFEEWPLYTSSHTSPTGISSPASPRGACRKDFRGLKARLDEEAPTTDLTVTRICHFRNADEPASSGIETRRKQA